MGQTGKLKPHHVTESGYRYYSQEQLYHYLGLKGETHKNRKTIGYCRVSSNKQKDDHERQIKSVRTYMYAKGYTFEIVTDIGSGISGLSRFLVANFKERGQIRPRR